MAGRSTNVLVPILMVVVIALIAAGLLTGVGAVQGAPAQTPWQELGPASTAN
jgi:phosphotransferase system  glucose/maltose/N-acetylglucosamine-specific IIC component